jgi:uncharacterized protein YgiM (DUF1202 family)
MASEEYAPDKGYNDADRGRASSGEWRAAARLARDEMSSKERGTTMPTRLAAPMLIAIAMLASGTAAASPLSVPILPSSQRIIAVADTEMTVRSGGGDVNLRLEPSTRSEVLDKLPRGTKVTVLNMVDGGKWVHVKVGDKEGYIARYLLK